MSIPTSPPPLARGYTPELQDYFEDDNKYPDWLDRPYMTILHPGPSAPHNEPPKLWDAFDTPLNTPTNTNRSYYTNSLLPTRQPLHVPQAYSQTEQALRHPMYTSQVHDQPALSIRPSVHSPQSYEQSALPVRQTVQYPQSYNQAGQSAHLATCPSGTNCTYCPDCWDRGTRTVYPRWREARIEPSYSAEYPRSYAAQRRAAYEFGGYTSAQHSAPHDGAVELTYTYSPRESQAEDTYKKSLERTARNAAERDSRFDSGGSNRKAGMPRRNSAGEESQRKAGLEMNSSTNATQTIHGKGKEAAKGNLEDVDLHPEDADEWVDMKEAIDEISDDGIWTWIVHPDRPRGSQYQPKK